MRLNVTPIHMGGFGRGAVSCVTRAGQKQAWALRGNVKKCAATAIAILPGTAKHHRYKEQLPMYRGVLRDGGRQQKCMKFLQEMHDIGNTSTLASHQVSNICSIVLCLKLGLR